MERLSMKKVYLDDFLCGTWTTIGIYGLLAILTFIAYKIGIIEINTYMDLSFETKNSVFEVLLIFPAFIYTMLVQFIPVAFSIWMYAEYNREFSNLPKVSNIIPVSSKNKMKKLIINTFVMFILFFIITVSLDIITFNGSIHLKLIWDLVYKIVMCGCIVLNVIIVDMWSRESHITKGSRNFWNIVTMIMTLFFLQFIWGILLSDEIMGVIAVSVIILIQIIYIFRNVENIKVD